MLNGMGWGEYFQFNLLNLWKHLIVFFFVLRKNASHTLAIRILKKGVGTHSSGTEKSPPVFPFKNPHKIYFQYKIIVQDGEETEAWQCWIHLLGKKVLSPSCTALWEKRWGCCQQQSLWWPHNHRRVPTSIQLLFSKWKWWVWMHPAWFSWHQFNDSYCVHVTAPYNFVASLHGHLFYFAQKPFKKLQIFKKTFFL